MLVGGGVVAISLLGNILLIVALWITWWENDRLKKALPVALDEFNEGFSKNMLNPSFRTFKVHVFVSREIAKEFARINASTLFEGDPVNMAVKNLKDRFAKQFQVRPKVRTTTPDGGEIVTDDRDTFSLPELERELNQWIRIDPTTV